MQHEIGIKKKTVEYYELDESAFVVPPDIEDEERETHEQPEEAADL